MKKSSKAAADRSPHTHVFLPGAGYVDVDREPRLAHPRTLPPCAPPQGAAKNSAHRLRTPAGTEMTLRWSGAAWLAPLSVSGNRLGWTADHLGCAGWTYVGAAQ